MPLLDINYLAVIIAAVAHMVLGALWYSPVLFANHWMKLTGKKMNELGSATTAYVYSTLGALLTSYIMAQIIYLLNATTIKSAAKIGLWTWVGFAVGTSISNVFFEGKSKQLYVLNQAYNLIGMVVIAVVIVLMR